MTGMHAPAPREPVLLPLPGNSRLPRDVTAACIFVVDDNAAIRRTIARYLYHAGFRAIVEAQDGREALSLMELHPPDLVISDLLMPKVDGLDLCRRMRADDRWADVPILIQAGVPMTERRGDAFAFGATDLISKPLDLREMLCRVRVHVEQRLLVRQLSEYRQKMRHELDLARGMQESLMPSAADIAAIERILPLDIASRYAPSSELGGDIWGIGMADERVLDIHLADFTGHGVAAALNTFRFHAFHRNQALDCLPLPDALSQMNAFLAGTLPAGQFATLVAARIDILAETVEICSAGGPPPVLRAGREAAFSTLSISGLPLGIRTETTFDVARFPFPPGSALLLYSDTATETPSPPHSVFDRDGLARFLDAGQPDCPAASMIERIMEVLSPHPLADDLTLVAIRHLEPA